MGQHRPLSPQLYPTLSNSIQLYPTLSNSIPPNPIRFHSIYPSFIHLLPHSIPFTLSYYFHPFEILNFYILHPSLQLKYYLKYCIFQELNREILVDLNRKSGTIASTYN